MTNVNAEILLSFSDDGARCRVCRQVGDGVTVHYLAGRVRFKGPEDNLLESQKAIAKTAHVCRRCVSRFVEWLYSREELWHCRCSMNDHDWTPWDDYYRPLYESEA